jgi:hypothetical protein
MTGLWWPVALILLFAPFGVYGYAWLDQQRLIAAHVRAIDFERKEGERLRKAAYDLGWRTAAANLRDQERGELDATRAALEESEAELARERRKGTAPPTPAEILELCKRSASCRERGSLK